MFNFAPFHRYKILLQNRFILNVGSLFAVSLFVSACGGGSSNKDDESEKLLFTHYLINVNGGDGGTADAHAGLGGQIDIISNGPHAGLVLHKHQLNYIPATFTPITAESELPNSLIISAEKTILVAPNEDPGNDTAYLKLTQNSYQFYLSDGDGDFKNDIAIDNLRVHESAILTIVNYSLSSLSLFIPNYAEIKGQIRIDNQGDETIRSFAIHADTLHIDQSAQLGHTQTEYSEIRNLQLIAEHTLVNLADIDISAGNGINQDADDAGSMLLSANQLLQNKGNLTLSGGYAQSHQGGSGGELTLISAFGRVENSGNLNAAGGSGAAGGNGGHITLSAGESSDRNTAADSIYLINRGSLDASGGLAETHQLSQGDAGPGGIIALIVKKGNLDTSAELLANGGSTNYPSNSTAGKGGSISITAHSAVYDNNAYIEPDLFISGNMSATGGSSANDSASHANDAGQIHIALLQPKAGYSAPRIRNGTLYLHGYDAIHANGGRAAYAAKAGQIRILRRNLFAPYASSPDNPPYAGILTNDVDLFASGGDATNSNETNQSSGHGGDISLLSLSDSIPALSELENTGNLDVSAGTAFASGIAGDAGNIILESTHYLNNHGTYLRAHGGNEGEIGGKGGSVRLLSHLESIFNSAEIVSAGGHANHQGGQGGDVELHAQNRFFDADNQQFSRIHSEGLILTSGGNADISGGDAGNIIFRAIRVDIYYDLIASGGNADPQQDGSKGGQGGLVIEDNYELGTTRNVAKIYNFGGNGETHGLPLPF